VSAIEQTAMPRLLPTLMPADLELRLLRKGVGELADTRAHCADCGRTPLTGESLHRYDAGMIVCELCRPLRRQEPLSSERVRHSEHGQAVKIRLRAA
jgi:hypothetical protein